MYGGEKKMARVEINRGLVNRINIHMNDEQMIWENYQTILTEAKVEIFYYDEESDDYDPWEIADKVEQVFKRAGIRTKRDKNISFFAMAGEEVIGATYSTTREDDAELYGGPEGENVLIYEFDIAVDPAHQGGTTGYLLTKDCVEDATNLSNEMSHVTTMMYNHVINPKMAQMLERLFGFQYLHEDDPEKKDGYSSTMVKYL
jgi:hypothetical protein